MEKLLIQQFLKENSFQDLLDTHGVEVSVSKNKKKISLNYSMINTKDNDILSHDCRGIILAKSDYSDFQVEKDKIVLSQVPGDTEIIAFGMRRFFNYGQGAANVNWNDPKLTIHSKLDGTLIQIYFSKIDNEWYVATRSCPEADINLNNGIFTFTTLFKHAIKESLNLSFDEFISYLDKNKTYCFELCGPYNRIVVDYKTDFISLLAVRDLTTLKEELPENEEVVLKGIVSCPQTYSYSSIEELVNWVSTLSCLEYEGVVIRDSNFDRIKLKNANYVVYNRFSDNLGRSERNCLELILLGKEDDVIPFMPKEIANNVVKLKTGLQKLINDYNKLYYNIYQDANAILPNDRKTFALTVKNTAGLPEYKNLWETPIYNIYSGRAADMLDFIEKNKKDGTWNSSFLDTLLFYLKNKNT
jgi:hypothetical protein